MSSYADQAWSMSMSADNQDYAGDSGIGGCFITVSFSLAMAAALYLVAGVIYYFGVFLAIAALVGFFGFYSAYRALVKQSRRTETN